MTDEEIIDVLGGTTKLARLLNYKIQRVQHWKTRGIPASVKLKFPHLFMNKNLKSISNQLKKPQVLPTPEA